MEAGQSQETSELEENNAVDSLTLARQAREKQGQLEVEFSYGGEADLHRHFTACKKNPGHQKFVPVDQFTMDHLPPGYQTDHLKEFVPALADLTVRVSVAHVSEKRPKTFLGSDMPYPGHNKRGDKMMRFGTGWLNCAEKFTNQNSKGTTCECEECLNSNTPQTEFGVIFIRTATHVVFDKLEGKDTTCHFFFDKGNKPDRCSNVAAIHKASDVWAAESVDYSDLKFNTHDLALIDRLKESIDKFSFANYKLRFKYPFPSTNKAWTPPSSDGLPENWRALTIIVSHPHGCSKQVSVGSCSNLYERTDKYGKFIYDTATCPGSSGALVFVLGNYSVSWTNYNYVHSGGVTTENLQVNYSGLGVYYLPK